MLMIIVVGIATNYNMSRIHELYLNYGWQRTTQNQLVKMVNAHQEWIAILCAKDIINGGTNWTFDPNDPNRINFISGIVDRNKGDEE